MAVVRLEGGGEVWVYEGVFGDAQAYVDCGVWGVGCWGLARTFQRVVPLEGLEVVAQRAERVVRRLFVDMVIAGFSGVCNTRWY